MLFKSLQMSVQCLRCTNVLPSQNIKTLIKSRNYNNFLHRRPVAVINEEVALDDAEAVPKPRKYVDKDNEHRPMKVKSRRHPGQGKHPRPAIVRNESFKQDGTLNYTTIIDNDRKLSSLMLNLKSKKMREKKSQILLEGQRLITDAIKAGLKLDIILFSRQTSVLQMPLPPRDVQLFKVPYKTLQLWSSLTTTPGVMGIFELPESFEKETTKDSIPLTIICDNVREPGNLGTILRAAAGAGCERVILTKGCVDLWDAKVLRSAAGAHFRVSISNSVEWEDIETLISPTAKLFAADNNVTVSAEADSKSDENDAEFMVSPDVSESTDKAEEPPVECSESETKVEDGEETIRTVSQRELANYLPVIPYYAADYTTNEVVLIVGGETHGLSYECVELIRQNGGVRVNVPLTNNVESLNTGMALGIVAFEVRKQFLLRKNSIVK